MEKVVAEARARFGAIHGVLHAAGILDDDLIQAKTQAAIDELFAPKIQGALVLDRLLGGSDLDFLALFSSTSSALGAAGQVDYVAANAFLNAFAHARRRPDGRPYVVALNWGVWNEVGMAAEAVARLEGDADEGVEPEPARHPLLDGRLGGSRERATFVSELDARTHWVLDQHRTAAGEALLPGTAYLELARAALGEVEGDGPFEIRDLVFLSPCAAPDGRSVTLRVRLAGGAGDFALEVESRPGEVALGSFELHAEARVARLDAPEPARLDLAALRARCSRRRDADEGGIRTGQERHLRFGSRWRCLREVHWGEG
jgi:hypothetical protein